jgi:Leucine-rich repeat (LRR) protein
MNLKGYIVTFILLNFLLMYGYSKEVKIEIVGNTNRISILVNDEIQTLTLTKTKSMVPNLIRINGLNDLIKLKILDLSFTNMSDKTDFSFLAEAKNIEELRMGFVTIPNFDFISYMHKIRRIIAYDFIDVINMDYVIDLKNNPNIERLDLGTTKLSKIPEIKNQPDTFKYLNLVGNDLSDIPMFFPDRKIKYKVVVSDDIYQKMNQKIIPNIVSWSQIASDIN